MHTVQTWSRVIDERAAVRRERCRIGQNRTRCLKASLRRRSVLSELGSELAGV